METEQGIITTNQSYIERMSVYFKFKNDLREQKIHVDNGIDIRVSDIKEEITRDLKVLRRDRERGERRERERRHRERSGRGY